MDFKIRKATMEDLQEILNLNDGLLEHEKVYDVDSYVQDWSFSKANIEYFSDLIKTQFVIVAILKEEIVGYLAGSIYQDDTYSFYEGITGEIENMFVREKYRKLGVGTKLLNSFFDWCKRKNVKRCFVTALPDNKNAMEFYKNNGFENSTITLKKFF